MEYKVLYRKYRPSTFEDLVGQEYVENILKKSITNGKLAHAYLFSGPKGTGKTSMARLFSKSINCANNIDGNPCGECPNCLNYENNPDIIEIDAASNNGVDEMRELRDNVKIMPAQSKYKIYIIDEVHMLSNSAFNALLKTLEEPPEHIIFIFATTDVQKVPSTVLSRCQRFDFKKIDSKIIAGRLKTVCEQEKISCDEDALNEIGVIADGSLRDALGLLDQLSAVLNNKIDMKSLSGILKTIPHEQFDLLYNSIFSGNIEKIDELFIEFKSTDLDTTLFLNDFINYLIKIAKHKDSMETNNNIDFDKLKELIYSLNNLLIENKSTINLFDLIELECLSLIECHSKSSKEVNKEIIEINVTKDDIANIQKKDSSIGNAPRSDESLDNNMSQTDDKAKEIIKEEKLVNVDNNDILLNNIDIRVNNCMATANKSLKTEIKKNWQSFCEDMSEKDLNNYNLVVDSSVEAVSDFIILISCESESQAMLFNEQHVYIEKKFNADNGSYKIVCLSKEKWEAEKKRFIKDKEKNIKWTIKEELVEEKPKKSKSKIETIASDIFDDVEVVID